VRSATQSRRQFFRRFVELAREVAGDFPASVDWT
jgi:hypothetical protein